MARQRLLFDLGPDEELQATMVSRGPGQWVEVLDPAGGSGVIVQVHKGGRRPVLRVIYPARCKLSFGRNASGAGLSRWQPLARPRRKSP